MGTSLSESPQRKALRITTKGGATLGDLYLQLFLFLENDRVTQALALRFPKILAIHTSQARVDSAQKQESGANEGRQPRIEGHGRSCLLRKVMTSVVPKAQYLGCEDLPLLAI